MPKRDNWGGLFAQFTDGVAERAIRQQMAGSEVEIPGRRKCPFDGKNAEEIAGSFFVKVDYKRILVPIMECDGSAGLKSESKLRKVAEFLQRFSDQQKTDWKKKSHRDRIILIIEAIKNDASRDALETLLPKRVVAVVVRQVDPITCDEEDDDDDGDEGEVEYDEYGNTI